MDLSNAELLGVPMQTAEKSIRVETATWSKAGQLDWWVKERQHWLGRVRGKDGRQRWIRAADLRPTSGSRPWLVVAIRRWWPGPRS